MRHYIFILSFIFWGCSKVPNQFADVDSYSIEYQILGTSKTCFALFEAGMGFDLETFAPIFDQISQSCTAIRYTRVGQGKSSKLSTELSAKNYAEIAKKLLEQLHIEQPVVFVGHSYGGTIARYFAELYPDHIKALLLIDPSTNWESKIIGMIDPNVVEKEITLLKNFGYSFAKERPRSDGTLNELRDFWLKYPLPDFADIGDIKVTVLASVQGMGDDLVIGSLEAMQIRADMLESWVNDFPRGRFVSTTKSGHFIHEDEPELVITEFQKLLSP